MSDQNLGNLVVRLLMDASRFDSVLAASQRKFGDLNQNLLRLGGRLSAAVTLPLVGVAAAGVRAFSHLDEAVTRAGLKFGGVSANMREALELTARSISTHSTTAVGEVVKGYDALAEAGYSASQAIDAVGTAEDFSVATGVEMGKSTKLLAEAQKELGLTSIFARENVRGLAQTANGLTLVSQKTGRSVEEIVRIIDRSSPEARARFATLVQGLGDVSKKAADEVRASFSGQLSIVGNQIGDVGTELGKILVPAVTRINGLLQEGLKFWRELSPESKKLAVSVGAVAASIPLVMAGAGIIGTVLSSWVAPVVAVGAGMVLVSDAVGLTNTGLLDAIKSTDAWTRFVGSLKGAFALLMGDLSAAQDEYQKVQDTVAKREEERAKKRKAVEEELAKLKAGGAANDLNLRKQLDDELAKLDRKNEKLAEGNRLAGDFGSINLKNMSISGLAMGSGRTRGGKGSEALDVIAKYGTDTIRGGGFGPSGKDSRLFVPTADAERVAIGGMDAGAMVSKVYADRQKNAGHAQRDEKGRLTKLAGDPREFTPGASYGTNRFVSQQEIQSRTNEGDLSHMTMAQAREHGSKEREREQKLLERIANAVEKQGASPALLGR